MVIAAKNTTFRFFVTFVKLVYKISSFDLAGKVFTPRLCVVIRDTFTHGQS